jgi:hypothetical protein
MQLVARRKYRRCHFPDPLALTKDATRRGGEQILAARRGEDVMATEPQKMFSCCPLRQFLNVPRTDVATAVAVCAVPCSLRPLNCCGSYTARLLVFHRWYMTFRACSLQQLVHFVYRKISTTRRRLLTAELMAFKCCRVYPVLIGEQKTSCRMSLLQFRNCKFSKVRLTEVDNPSNTRSFRPIHIN